MDETESSALAASRPPIVWREHTIFIIAKLDHKLVHSGSILLESEPLL